MVRYLSLVQLILKLWKTVEYIGHLNPNFLKYKLLLVLLIKLRVVLLEIRAKQITRLEDMMQQVKVIIYMMVRMSDPLGSVCGLEKIIYVLGLKLNSTRNKNISLFRNNAGAVAADANFGTNDISWHIN